MTLDRSHSSLRTTYRATVLFIVLTFTANAWAKENGPRGQQTHGKTYRTGTFRVFNASAFPLPGAPPPSNFVTVMPGNVRVPLFDQGVPVGEMFALTPNPKDEEVPVCRVTESRPNPGSPGSRSDDASQVGGPGCLFPPPGIESFLCEVTFGFAIQDAMGFVVASGPRLVKTGTPFVDPADGRRTIDVEIVEMYLSGYDSRDGLLTVRGGRNFGLPPILGQIKSISPGCDFPATLYFDLVLEVTDWTMEGPVPAGCTTADFDADGDVDIRDFAVFQNVFTGP